MLQHSLVTTEVHFHVIVKFSKQDGTSHFGHTLCVNEYTHFVITLSEKCKLEFESER